MLETEGAKKHPCSREHESVQRIEPAGKFYFILCHIIVHATIVLCPARLNCTYCIESNSVAFAQNCTVALWLCVAIHSVRDVIEFNRV